ncbi:MAG: TerB family tellurite resistance protein [Bacteroidota bacterium]
MLSHEDQISVLAHLSKADNEVADEEYKLILFIADGFGIEESRTKEIMNNPGPIPDLHDLNPDDKFLYLFNIIKMMKVDGKVHKNEVRFCEKIAVNLGYKPGVISGLSAYIYKDPAINSNRDFLRSIADKHLKPMNEG